MDHTGPPLVTRQVSNLLVVHFIGRFWKLNHALKVGQLFPSSDVGFTVLAADGVMYGCSVYSHLLSKQISNGDGKTYQ